MDSINSKDSAPELSIIIISYNTRQITLDCLNSIEKSLQTAPFQTEVVLVDNASTDDSVETIRKFKPTHFQLNIIANKDNTGFGPANNQGVKEAKGKYILLLNSDTVVLKNALEKLLKFYKENAQKVHFLGGKLLNADMTPQPSAAPFYTPAVVFAALFLKGDYWGLTRYSPDSTRQVDWLSGACILTTKEIYEKVNGFDENIFMYMDEVDLLYRARKNGFMTYFYPEAQFIHLGSASSGKRTFPMLQVYKGFLFFYRKHYSPFAIVLLKGMLQLKALISLLIGKITNNSYLIETYGKAYQIASLD